MKLLRLSISLLLIQLFFFIFFSASLSAQEAESVNTQPGSISDIIPARNENEGAIDKEKEDAIKADSANKKKIESNDDAQKKAAPKKTPAANIVQKTENIKPEAEEIKNDKPETVKIDDSLLLIDEGNFKYRRIPDIKLVDKIPEPVEKNIATETYIETEPENEKSYMDIWKFLIVLIIAGIFILYMSRASNTAKINHRASKYRKVLNSYRK